MKQIFASLSIAFVSLGFYAFSPAPIPNQEIYSETIHQFSIDELNEEVSSFDEFQTRTYTSDKAVYNKRIRTWTLTPTNDNYSQTSIEEVIDRN